ncbi:hypothetical protein DICVIV_14060 [Dictyocaulus viviparus]|uniref:Uncharacterized protein n=1 Tax=Dictyocaulus viviparus TaxID=29172 RepID=A0A0D8X8B8_DICVI|nr:hypothetical protein DICVIV_14060 [Dictyocaulus viviparus]
MTSNGDRITTFNVTMLSPLSYTAVLVKEQGEDKFETAIICSFHTSRGIVAAVNYPMPIFSLEFIDTTKPEGHTDSTHTLCSTTIFNPPPSANARFKLISGRWQGMLVATSFFTALLLI